MLLKMDIHIYICRQSMSFCHSLQRVVVLDIRICMYFDSILELHNLYINEILRLEITRYFHFNILKIHLQLASLNRIRMHM